MGGHQVHRVVQGAEHPQPQEVELDKTDRRTVVLVPLEHAAVHHAPPLHRAHLGHGAVADHHAPRMDTEVAGGVAQLVGQGGHVVRQARLSGTCLLSGGGPDPSPTIQTLGEGILLAGVVAQRPGYVTHR